MNDNMINFDETKSLSRLDYATVLEHLKKIARQDKMDTENTIDMSNVLTAFFLQSNFDGLGAEEAISCITDGPNDQGIDAVYIDEAEDGHKTVNIIQTKLTLNPDRFNDIRFSANEVTKLLSTFNDMVINLQNLDHANDRLKQKLIEVSELEGPRYRVVLLTTAALPPSKDAQEKIETKLNHYNDNADYVSAQFVGLNQLINLLPELKEAKLDFELKFDGVPVDTISGGTRIVIGQIQARKIAELVGEKQQKLFDRNVRIYLKKRNQVNKQIYSTAVDEHMSNYFFILNNGITVICSKIGYMRGESFPTINITGGQIVNGGQTSNSIYEAYKAKKLQDGASVLIRIIVTDDSDLVHEITKATNSQTAVRNPDLYSNDPVQKKIKSRLLDKYGYYYEAKKNEAQAKAASKLRIDKETAAQAYYSYSLQEPGEAKTNKAKLFGDYYKKIFDDLELNDEKVDELFFAHQLLRDIKLLSSDPKFKEYGWIRDAELTSLALLKNNSAINNYGDLISDRSNNHIQLRKDYAKILAATKKVVQEEVKNVGDENFEKRRFFIANNTLKRIQKVL